MGTIVGKSLYYIEFGVPNIMNNYSSYSDQKPLFVLAENFESALIKAVAHTEFLREVSKEGIFGEHGSLKPEVLEEQIKPIIVKSIKLVSELIIV